MIRHWPHYLVPPCKKNFHKQKKSVDNFFKYITFSVIITVLVTFHFLREQFMITREADYCIRTVLHLSRPEHRDQPVTVEKLAGEMDIPVPFLRRILAQLIDAGLVVSHRGRNGGLSLNGDPASISLLDVLRKADDKGVLLNRCLAEDGCCTHRGNCTVHNAMQKLQTMLEEQLQSITFDRLV
jgi:Rrf2 family iron-sulfur cluster assembly transcriptional regulator